MLGIAFALVIMSIAIAFYLNPGIHGPDCDGAQMQPGDMCQQTEPYVEAPRSFQQMGGWQTNAEAGDGFMFLGGLVLLCTAIGFINNTRVEVGKPKINPQWFVDNPKWLLLLLLWWCWPYWLFMLFSWLRRRRKVAHHV